MATSPESAIVLSLLRPGVSVDSAVQQLLNVTNAVASRTDFTDSEDLSDLYNNVWRSLMEDAVANTALSEQTPLVEFVQTLQRQKVINPVTGTQLRCKSYYDSAVWTELPCFGINVADEWNYGTRNPGPFQSPIDRSKDPECITSEEALCYYNKIAFLARLTSASSNSVPDPETAPGPFDFSLYALWAFRSAFENDVEPGVPRIIRIRAASLWMIHCAERLWANVLIRRKFVHKATNYNRAEPGRRYYREKKRRWLGFNPERWNIWIQGLESGLEVDDEEVEVLVQRALREVENVKYRV
jgi:hypothetical protein